MEKEGMQKQTKKVFEHHIETTGFFEKALARNVLQEVLHWHRKESN